MIRVAIADDHKLVLNGIRELIQEDTGIEIIAAVTDGVQLLNILRDQEVDVVLSDIDMPGMSGLDVVQKVKNENLKSKVILLSVHDERSIIRKAFLLGAFGYLLKRSDPDQILSAIQTVYSGKKFFDDDVLSISMAPESDELPGSDIERVSLLTNREKEIVSLIMEGNSNQKISEILFLSKRTIDTHRNNLMVKLGFKNTVELVKFALKNGLSN